MVNKIDYSATNSTTTTCANGISYTSNKQVIVTASMEVLKSEDIAFIPEPPQNYMDAIAKFDMQPALKAFLEFLEQFYPVSPVFVDTDLDWYETDTQTD